jgi:hypothetical protein
MTYNYEWPKTAADYAQLYGMKNWDLREIHTDVNRVGGKEFTIGIKFYFHGETNPITYGKKNRNTSF